MLEEDPYYHPQLRGNWFGWSRPTQEPLTAQQALMCVWGHCHAETNNCAQVSATWLMVVSCTKESQRMMFTLPPSAAIVFLCTSGNCGQTI